MTIMQTPHLTNEIKEVLYADIKEFRETFMLPVEDPKGFSAQNDDLHTSLWIEELTELADAENLIDIADSLIDQSYVLVGRCVQLGEWIPVVEYIVSCLIAVAKSKDIDFIRCWKEIHSSNMSKLALDETGLQKNIDFYYAQGVTLNPIKTDKGYVLKCNSDCIYKGNEVKEGKVMKSIFYRDADLSFLIK